MTSTVSVQRIFFKKNFKARHQTGPDKPSATQLKFIGFFRTSRYFHLYTTLGLNLGPFVRYHGPRVGYTSEPSPLVTMEKEKSVQTISTPKSIIHPKIQRKLKIWGGGGVGTEIIRHDPCTPLPKQYENEKPRNPHPHKNDIIGWW